MNRRNSTPTGEGTLRTLDGNAEPLPDEISEGDMELIQAFQQDVAAAQRAYNSLMAQMAGRYQLRESDRIDTNTRKITRAS